MTKQARHFYTDPLAAAWQAKYHGMRFKPESEIHARAQIKDAIQHSYKCQIEIHPDSLLLLEPKSGDIVTYSLSNHILYFHGWLDEFKEEFWGSETPINHGSDRVQVDDLDNINEIIQRNGIPFISPEREEA